MTTKLMILPHAGGSSLAYQGFFQHLPDSISLFFHDYPGHGRRSGDPLLKDMTDLVADLMTRAGDAGFFHTDTAWGIFGHSMGALVAHAVIQKLLKQHMPVPAVFFASGARPPSTLADTADPAPVHGTAKPKLSAHLSRDLFWAKMAGYGGIPREIMNNPEIQHHFERILKNDFLAVETHIPDMTPINVPIHVLYGKQDRRVVVHLNDWPRLSVSETRFHPFDGSHFFVFDHLPRISEIIGRTLSGTGEDFFADQRKLT